MGKHVFTKLDNAEANKTSVELTAAEVAMLYKVLGSEIAKVGADVAEGKDNEPKPTKPTIAARVVG